METTIYEEAGKFRIDLSSKELQYSGECLGDVISLQEAALMWDMADTTLRVMWQRGKIDGRRTITGGTVFLKMSSIMALYGEPKFDPIALLKKGK